MKHYGIWCAYTDRGPDAGYWASFGQGVIFWTTCRAVAEAQLDTHCRTAYGDLWPDTYVKEFPDESTAPNK